MNVMSQSHPSKHPKEHLIHDECYIMIHRNDEEGCDIIIWDDDVEVIEEWEPDFEWAWETASYFSKKYNLEIVDELPY